MAFQIVKNSKYTKSQIFHETYLILKSYCLMEIQFSLGIWCLNLLNPIQIPFFAFPEVGFLFKGQFSDLCHWSSSLLPLSFFPHSTYAFCSTFRHMHVIPTVVLQALILRSLPHPRNPCSLSVCNLSNKVNSTSLILDYRLGHVNCFGQKNEAEV